MKNSLAIASILFVAAPALAQPILLAEFERREGLSETTSVRWDISAPPFTWERLTRQSDEGAVFQAPPEFVAAANQTDYFSIQFHCFNCNGTVDRPGGDSITVDRIFEGFNDIRLLGRAFVPQLGANFTGYEITSATQTITRWRPFVGTGGEFWTKVQLFGEQLPRPPVYPPLTGDYNKNGTVDAADYVVWRELMSRPEGSRPDLPNAVAGPRPPMDGDYGPWRYFFGESVPPISGASAVPEPATWLPAILALCCICRTARRVPLASPVQSAFNIDPAYRSTHRE